MEINRMETRHFPRVKSTRTTHSFVTGSASNRLQKVISFDNALFLLMKIAY